MANPEWPVKTAEALHHTREYGDFTIAIYDNFGKEHVVLIRGSVKDQESVPVRVQSECLPGTALESADCDCQDQIKGSLEIISSNPVGVFLYMREEGRGYGLTTKIRALANKNSGMDTFKATEALGLPSDIRDYKDAARILISLGIGSVDLITNNPNKISGLREEGVIIAGRTPIEVIATDITRLHLRAKKEAGHYLTQPL